jgi:hypothetical protein
MRGGYPAGFNAGTPDVWRTENLSRIKRRSTVLGEGQAYLTKPREDAISRSLPTLRGIPKSR